MISKPPHPNPNVLPILITLVGFAIPFGGQFATCVLIVLYLYWLLYAKHFLRNHWTGNKKIILILLPLYFINLFGLIHSEEFGSALTRLESRLPVLLLPFVIFTSDLKTDTFRKFSLALCIGCVMAGAICLGSIVTAKEAVTLADISYINFVEPLHLHPTYFGTMVSFGLLFLILEIRKDMRRRYLVVITCFILLLLVLEFLLQSRAAQLGLIVGLLAMLFIKANVWIRVAALVLFFSAVAGLIIFGEVTVGSSFQSNRYSAIAREFKTDFLVPDSLLQEGPYSVTNHLRSWYCATSLTSDYHFFTGFGSGDEKNVLVSCYESHGWTQMAKERMNAHNEFLSAMLRTGIMEVLCLLAWIIFPLVDAIKQRNYLLLAFLTLSTLTLIFNTIPGNYFLQFLVITPLLLWKASQNQIAIKFR